MNENWEKVSVYLQNKKQSDLAQAEQNILSDLLKLGIKSEFHGSGDDAYTFNKLLKDYEMNKNIFLFNSYLENKYPLIIETISEVCHSSKFAQIENSLMVYLNKVKQGQINAKKMLYPDDFDGSYFCDWCEMNGNLNVNFTRSSQYLRTDKFFSTHPNELNELKNVNIFDNGDRMLTINKRCGKRNYLFAPISSCQLVVNQFINNKNYCMFLDIVSGKLMYVKLNIDDKFSDPSVLTLLPLDKELILIEGRNLTKILYEYFSEEEKVQSCSLHKDECLPIKTLEELRNWKPLIPKHVVECLKSRKKIDGKFKTLVCHDMKGGYLEDKFINGVNGKDIYFFVHWSAVDSFVYFSHYFVTIPPCGWISSAHRNGVKMLGTFITEWHEGVKICEEVFKDIVSAYHFGMQLVHIALHYSFDGWLINIENRLKVDQVPILRKFICYLTEKMHMFCPGSEVIWYDSVSKNGNLDWQNALNDLNDSFFSACDGIYLNYGWKDKELELSRLNACERETDVYVGIDVFGRNTFAPSGFSTNVAVERIKKYGMSVAIFAPGWVYECNDVKQFKENQFKFWNAVCEVTSPRVVSQLPYSTSFCPGFGNKMFRNGKIISSQPWFNMTLQQPQPNYFSSSDHCITLFDKSAYNGGGCIEISTCMTLGESSQIQFLKTFFEFDGKFIISYTFKPMTKDVSVMLVLEMISSDSKYCVLLSGKEGRNLRNSAHKCYLIPTPQDVLDEVGYSEPNEDDGDWIKRTYLLKYMKNEVINCLSMNLASINNATHETASVLLGGVQITPVKESHKLSYSNLSCKLDADTNILSVNCLLQWHCSLSYSSDLYYSLPNRKLHYLGTTTQPFFNVALTFDVVSEIVITLQPHKESFVSLSSQNLLIPLTNLENHNAKKIKVETVL